MHKLVALGACMALAVVTQGSSAHHAVNSQFDITQNKKGVGVLTQFELINPHTYVHFDVKGPGGRIEKWSFETGAPVALRRAGLSVREAFKRGQMYTFFYSPSRDGSHTGLMSAITLPDGRFIAFGGATNVDAAKALSGK